MPSWRFWKRELKKRLLLGPDEDPLAAYRHKIEVKEPGNRGRVGYLRSRKNPPNHRR